MKVLGTLALLAALLTGASCATAPTPGSSSRMYAIRVSSLNGHPTSNHGAPNLPACTLQFGEQVTRVWLAHPSRENAVSPVIAQADEATLKAGILLERSFQEAVVHAVTDAELASGTAVIYIPSVFHLTTVELSFEPVGESRRSEPQDDLPKRGAGLDESVSRRNVSKR